MKQVLLIIFTIFFSLFALSEQVRKAESSTSKQRISERLAKHFKNTEFKMSDFDDLDFVNCTYEDGGYLEGVKGKTNKGISNKHFVIPKGAIVRFCSGRPSAVYANDGGVIRFHKYKCKERVVAYESPLDPVNKRQIFICELSGNQKINGAIIPDGIRITFSLSGEACIINGEASQRIGNKIYEAGRSYRISNSSIERLGEKEYCF